MEIEHALQLVNQMEAYAQCAGVSLLFVGSIGYRSALRHPERLADCDDIDCIFVYEALDDLQDCPYLRIGYLQQAAQYLAQKRADLFSTKIVVSGIQISADFIAQDYLMQLAQEPFTQEDKFRVKLTDAVEKEYNLYCNFLGEALLYQKRWTEEEGLRFYRLPIHLYDTAGKFYPGVLLNKFLYNPVLLYMTESVKNLVVKIQDSVQQMCEREKGAASVCNSSYKKEDFSEETKRFLSQQRKRLSL